jgi:hypothetical protein
MTRPLLAFSSSHKVAVKFFRDAMRFLKTTGRSLHALSGTSVSFLRAKGSMKLVETNAPRGLDADILQKVDVDDAAKWHFVRFGLEAQENC